MKSYKEMREKQTSFLKAMGEIPVVKSVVNKVKTLVKEPVLKTPSKSEWDQK